MKTYIIHILSRQVPIQTESSEEHVRELVNIVEEKLKQVDPEQKLPEVVRCILVMLNLADEYVIQKAQVEALKEKMRERIAFILDGIDRQTYIC